MTFTIDDEPVKLLLSGIFKSGKTMFFRIDANGRHVKVNVSLALRTLNMSHGAISRLIAAFPWPKLQYYSDYMRKVDAARDKPNEKRVKIRTVAEDEPDEGDMAAEEPEEVPNPKNGTAKKHYYIVQQGSYFGVFNAFEASVDLYKTRAEAEEHLRDLLHGRDGYRISYGGMGNRSRSREAAEIHY